MKTAGHVLMLLLCATALFGATPDQLEDQLLDLEMRLEEVETRVLIDKLQMGLGFVTRMDNLKTTLGDKSKRDQENIWSGKLMLNIGADIAPEMKFNGRLSMYKNWAASSYNPQSDIDPRQGRYPGDSSLFVERAYVDWTLDSDWATPLTLTLGRQPSSDGPSHHFKDNTVRKSTYSALAFDGAADGVVATLNLEKPLNMPHAAVRLAYGKGYQHFDANASSPSPYTGATGVEDTALVGLFIDGSIPSVRGSLIQLGYVTAQDMVANPNTGDANVGDLALYGLMAEFTNLNDTRLDLFAHYGMSEGKPNGNAPDGYGLLTSTPGDTSEKSGDALWAGLRYTFNFGCKPRLGFEYNQGSKNWSAFTWGSNDPLNKLAVRGQAYEVYFIRPLNRYSHLRLGYVSIEHDYSGSGNYLGAPMKVSDAGAMAVEKTENLYLLFNLLY